MFYEGGQGKVVPCRYMAPETLRKYRFTRRSDIWSIGAFCDHKFTMTVSSSAHRFCWTYWVIYYDLLRFFWKAYEKVYVVSRDCQRLEGGNLHTVSEKSTKHLEKILFVVVIVRKMWWPVSFVLKITTLRFRLFRFPECFIWSDASQYTIANTLSYRRIFSWNQASLG